MRTSTYEDAREEEIVEEPSVVDEIERVVEVVETVEIARIVECDDDLASPGEVAVRTVDAYRAERWSDAPVSPPEEEDTEQALVTAEPISEMYYTASSEVSLLSDGDVPEKPTADDDAAPQGQDSEDKESRKECVMSGHVAAMRERFESMTRAEPAPAAPAHDAPA